MKGILLAAHGSRAKATELAMEEIVDMVRKKLPEEMIEVGYMEFCEKTIVGGLETLANKGAKEIKVVPYFLFEGIHIRQDIPEEIEKFTSTHPDVKVTMGSILGVDERLADIVADRIIG
ncbi:MAG: sirohydrochlorin chelatase [Filifactoraceae bacterium]